MRTVKIKWALVPDPHSVTSLEQASDQDVSWASSTGGVQGTSSWQETPEQTQNTLEGSHISSGLGTPWESPGGAEGENVAGLTVKPGGPTTRPQKLFPCFQLSFKPERNF